MPLILLSYFVVRPLLTLAGEGTRALLMLSWSKEHLVQLHLGSFGHHGGLYFRIGRLVVRIHPYWLLMRGSISDTYPTPTGRQFALWCAAPLLLNLVIFSSCLGLVWYSTLPDAWKVVMGMLGFLSFVELGFGVFREMEPIPMHCGLVYAGPMATLKLVLRHPQRGKHYLQGLRSYLREDYPDAIAHYLVVLNSGHPSIELLEDLAYAQFAVGRAADSLATFALLEQQAVPNATQNTVAAMAAYKLGDFAQATSFAQVALDSTPGHAMALNFRAWMQLQEGKYAEAKEDLLVATRNAPEYATAWGNLARCYWGLGEMEKARDAAAVAFRHDPMDLGIGELRRILGS